MRIYENDKQILDHIYNVDWSQYNGSPWYRAQDVIPALSAFIYIKPNDQIEVHAEESKLLFGIGNDHAGTYYPAILSSLEVILYAACDHSNPPRCACAIEALIDIFCAFSADIEGYDKQTRTEIETFVQNHIYALKDELEPKRSLDLDSKVKQGIIELLDAFDDLGPDHRSSKPMPESND